MKFNRLKRVLSVALTGVIVAGSLAGCGGSASTGTGKNAKAASTSTSSSDLNKATTLNIAYQSGHYPIFIMKKEGTLEKALKDAGYDIKVKYTQFESGPPENESFASGQQDIGAIGNVPAVTAIASGQDRKFIGESVTGAKGNAILVKKGSPIKSVADLKGKKVGLVVGSCSENLLYNHLKKAGISYDEVDKVNLAPSEQTAGLTSGQVDAIVTWNPTLTTLVNGGEATVLADGEDGMLGGDPLVVTSDYLDKNPDIVKIFLKVYKEGAERIEGDREKFAEEYADEVGVDKDDFLVMLNDSEWPTVITEDDAKGLQTTAEFLKVAGLVNTEVNVSDYVVYDLVK